MLFVRRGEKLRTTWCARVYLTNVLPTGPYAPTILRFQLSFPTDYPERPPIIKFFTDIFHPLITPLTTYTYTTNDTGADTVSATDEERLPPGGFSLQHGFPHWLGRIKGDAVTSTQRPESPGSVGVGPAAVPQVASDAPSPPATIQPRAVHIVEVLYYLRSTFESESVLDSVPLEAAGNPGAWHAWRTHRAGMIGRPSTVPQPGADTTLASPTSRQQTRGARRPGEWNWEGVWEERVRKGMQMSVSEHVLYGGTSPSDDLVSAFG